MSKKTRIDMGEADAAIVIRADGSIELTIPNMDDGDAFVPDNVRIIGAFGIVAARPEMLQAVERMALAH